VFVDYASNGTFVQGDLPSIARVFGTYIRLGQFHAPNGQEFFANKDGIAAVTVDDRYADNASWLSASNSRREGPGPK
jgi:hypothetical protein